MEQLVSYLIETLPDRILLGIRFEGIRYAIGTIGVFLSIWVLLAPLLKNLRIRKPMPSKKLHKQIVSELANSFRTVCIFVALDILVFDFAELGLFRVYSDIADYGWVWFSVSIPVGIVLHDAYFYWMHRLMHHKALYKTFHLTHHRSHNPTPFTAYSFAPGEAVVMYAFIPLLMAIVPLHTAAISTILLVMIFKNAIGHCGYELFPAGTTKIPFLKHNTTVTHHDMHHEKASGNFGFYFTWWDKWMGTEHVNYEARFEEVTARQPAVNTVTT